MAYSTGKIIDINLEDTAIPNLFIMDYMPDVPDGDFVKVYIYAYMCCRQGIALTHAELADRAGVELEKVLAAWRYFAGRRIVKITPQAPGDETHFDVEFIDVKGMLYAKEPHNRGGAHSWGSDSEGDYEGDSVSVKSLSDPELAALFKKLAVICGAPTIDGGDAQLIISWLEEEGATAEIVEAAYLFCRDERGETGVRYVGKVVREWAGKGLKTTEDVREYRARTDARSAVHKKLMEALGMRYSIITKAEEDKFNLWIDDYGYTPEQLLELSKKTAGVGNKLRYLGGIIRKEREAEGKDTGAGAGAGAKGRNGLKDRNEYYRQVRQQNEDAAAARLEEAYTAAPALKKIDDETAALNMELVKTLTSGMADKKGAIDRLNDEISGMSARRKEALAEGGFAPDYTDVSYNCPRCRDTGILENGVSCDCYSL